MQRRGMTVPILCALLMALALSPAASAEQSQVTLGPGETVVVLTLTLGRGDAVDYSWSTNRSVNFRVENQAGNLMFVDQPGQVGSGAFSAPADGGFTFGFRNRNDFPVIVQWTINRQPSVPLVIGVIVAALLVVGGIAALALLLRRKRTPPPPEFGPRTP